MTEQRFCRDGKEYLLQIHSPQHVDLLVSEVDKATAQRSPAQPLAHFEGAGAHGQALFVGLTAAGLLQRGAHARAR